MLKTKFQFASHNDIISIKNRLIASSPKKTKQESCQLKKNNNKHHNAEVLKRYINSFMNN